MKSDIAFAPMVAMNNHDQVKKAKNVGCYHCLKVFESREIIDFTDDGKTAICPKCGNDCITLHTELKLLKEIHDYWIN